MSEGALLDLVARGKKDAFFHQGAHRSWFGSAYQRRSPSTREIILQATTGTPRFGHWIDIDLPRTGDMLMYVDIRIQIPTWLPPEVVDVNRENRVEVKVEDDNGIFQTYGWTNGIANFLFPRWALYMDNIMLQEGYGDYNDWQPNSDASQFHAPLINASTGTHDGSTQNIQRNATPGEIAFRVPLIGCQGYMDTGLPLSAFQAQKLTLRLWIADKTDLVESAITGNGPENLPLFEICPAPWGGRRISVQRPGDPMPNLSYRTLQSYEMAPLVLYGRFAVLHFEPEVGFAIRNMTHHILYKQQMRQDFTIEDAEFNGVTPTVKQTLELPGLFQRFIFGMISLARQRQNKYRDLTPPDGGEWLESITLLVNGQERVMPWDPKKFQELAINTQLPRDVERELYFLIFGVSPDLEPAGPLNLARTQKVVLKLNLRPGIPTDPTVGTRQTFGRLKGEAWNVLDITGGVARVRFNDLA